MSYLPVSAPVAAVVMMRSSSRTREGAGPRVVRLMV